jgi:hypothetical protein
MAKEGRSARKTQDEVQSMILELNKCNNELPEKYKDVSKGLESAIGEMQKAMTSESTGAKTQREHLLEADVFLKGCIHGLKAEADNRLDQTVSVIARANK